MKKHGKFQRELSITRWRDVLILFCLASMLGACTESSSQSELRNEVSDEVDSEQGYHTPFDYYAQCSDARCEFDLFEGDRIAFGVPTWHAMDTGVSLEGNPAVITVSDPYAAHPEVPVKCYTIHVLGRWDDDVELFFETHGEYGVFGMSASEKYVEDTDALVDGIVSDDETDFRYSIPLVGGDWNLNTLEIRTLKHRGKLDFSIRKIGAGEAVFYFIEIEGENVCTADAIEVD